MQFIRTLVFPTVSLAVGMLVSGVNQPAIADDASLHRDTWGVPHVVANNEAAGFFALGYAQRSEERRVGKECA